MNRYTHLTPELIKKCYRFDDLDIIERNGLLGYPLDKLDEITDFANDDITDTLRFYKDIQDAVFDDHGWLLKRKNDVHIISMAPDGSWCLVREFGTIVFNKDWKPLSYTPGSYNGTKAYDYIYSDNGLAKGLAYTDGAKLLYVYDSEQKKIGIINNDYSVTFTLGLNSNVVVEITAERLDEDGDKVFGTNITTREWEYVYTDESILIHNNGEISYIPIKYVDKGKADVVYYPDEDPIIRVNNTQA